MQKSPATAVTDSPPLAPAGPGRDRAWVRLPLALLLVIAAVHLALNLGINDGHLTYTLDDAYIHMALAEGIAYGHFGINPGEVCAPSSSILWPFLLAPFMLLSFGAVVPFVVNLACAAATVLLMVRTMAHGFSAAGLANPVKYAAWVAAALVPVTNLIGLIFSGMEHSLQLLLAAAVVHGLVCALSCQRVPRWLPAALIAAPLVRYEMFALTLPAAVCLYLSGHRRVALVSALTALGLAAGYSGYLAALGLGALPTSVAMRSDVVCSGWSIAAITDHFRGNLLSGEGTLLAVVFIPLAAVALDRSRRREHRLLAAAGAAGIVLHLSVGRLGGWFHARYDMYILLSTLLLTVFLASAPLGRFLQRAGGVRAAVLAVAAVALVAFPQLHRLSDLQIAASNIYQQQYQMHRFITEYYHGPVAANDIGWVAFQNDETVVDLVGLADSRNVGRRKEASSGQWMTEAAAAGGARLAIIYESWFAHIPDSWIPVADLFLGHRRTSAADRKVTFYALDRAAADSARILLTRFAPTLPKGVRLDLRPSE